MPKQILRPEEVTSDEWGQLDLTLRMFGADAQKIVRGFRDQGYVETCRIVGLSVNREDLRDINGALRLAGCNFELVGNKEGSLDELYLWRL